jgi:anti-anti-sigma factor
MALSPVPVWLLDVEALRVCWANPAAVELWQAPSAQELQERDLLTGAPQKVLVRLQHTIAAVRTGQVLQEEWAFYPRGNPTMVLLHLLFLSAPILDVGRHTIAVPVIGELTTERCQELAQRLLQALVERRARRAILDLTGVSGIDSAGVGGLQRLLDAIRLLGASPIITGISAQVAQRLARHGAELSQLAIRRSLAEAIGDLMTTGAD